MWSAERASFFSLAKTFSFPGMTTYSVSKSFSTSTPRLLLGRSFTWPKDASTVNPLPRYFWIVFALAGDATMTRPLDNGSSNDSLFDSKLTSLVKFRETAGYELRAASFEQARADRLAFTAKILSTATWPRHFSLAQQAELVGSGKSTFAVLRPPVFAANQTLRLTKGRDRGPAASDIRAPQQNHGRCADTASTHHLIGVRFPLLCSLRLKRLRGASGT